ncbi:MAG: hypothetical protein K8S24_01005 [Candidatus Aegiribacteria sp.]|nr:hypothetical protein [Candidatus Aegiribacteria sp.]
MYYIFIVFISIFGVREPFSIDWNMFDSSSNPEFCCIGFGDWSYAAVGIPSEGPHPGLDFKPPFISDPVLSPANCITWVQNVHPDTTGWGIIIDDEEHIVGSDCIGWSIGHCIEPDHTIIYEGACLMPKQSLCDGVYQGGSEWFPHIHLSWYENGLWGNNINPFNGYLDPPAGYDALQFRRIPHIEEGDYGIGTYRGIIFDIQDKQPLDETGDMNHWHGQSIHGFRLFQDRVYGKVDFIVSPASVDCISPFADSMAGVSEIWVDIKTIDGDPTVYTARKFVDFINAVIPSIYEHMSEYSALFFDPETVGFPGVSVS